MMPPHDRRKHHTPAYDVTAYSAAPRQVNQGIVKNCPQSSISGRHHSDMYCASREVTVVLHLSLYFSIYSLEHANPVTVSQFDTRSFG
jgi:hypothetical protein